MLLVHGFDVAADVPEEQFALFQAWLPHLTRASASGPAPLAGDWRLHHTAYTRYDTEYFAWVARQWRLAGEEEEYYQLPARGSR